MSELDPNSPAIELTQTVKKGGCAAKLPAGQLRAILGRLPIHKPAELHVGTEHMDDACLWDLGDDRYLIQTLDFFTPIVDDAEDFGAIAAANALSDVYAMGGEPKVALSILAFPTATLPIELLEPLMNGAIQKIHESGACLAGGHTIDDETLKFGLSVTGFVAKKRAWTNSGAKPGDVLILTKGLGTGTITTALKIREAEQMWVDSAIASMKTLNRVPELIQEYSVHAATDVTGFGLAGHGLQLGRASGAKLVIDPNALPRIRGAMECIGQEMLNRAHKTNLDYVQNEIDFSKVPDELKWLALDPQTSGGLLLSVPEERSQQMLAKIQTKFPLARMIGRVEAAEPGRGGLEFRPLY